MSALPKQMTNNPIAKLLALSLFACLVGCQPAGQEAISLLDNQISEVKIDDLARTMDFVLSERRFQQKEFVEKVATGLNRWVSAFPEKFENDTWQLDEMVKPLLDEYKDLAIVRQTDKLDFLNTDAFFLHQHAWLDKLTKRLVASTEYSQLEFYRLAAENYRADENVEQPLVEIVQKLHKELGTKEAQDLANSLKLFDWVVRNVQLLPETENAEDEIDELKLNDNASTNLAWSGVPATGYIRYPWQVLLYSRGDYVERAKLFMAMTHQIGIDSVLLGVKDGDGVRPWCVGLIINGQNANGQDKDPELYLFDTRLGLPIPGKEIGSIATLAKARSNPELLNSLDLSLDESLADNSKYWVKSDDAKEVEALIYCSPEGCSRRIYDLERNLTAEYRLRLTSSPTKVAKRLEGVAGLTPKAWDISFRTHAFRQAVRDALTLAYNDELQAKLKWHYLDEVYIDEFPLYRTSRSMYFGGNFETERNAIRRNAIENFYSLIYSDKTIDSLGTDKFLQRRLGITKEESLSVAEFQQRLKIVQGQMRLVRRDAGYFLSQCHFDNGNIGTAANWLLRIKDTTGIENAERWSDAVDYLKARSFESRKEYDQAISLYKEQKDSTQVHGNLLRARMLKTLADRLVTP